MEGKSLEAVIRRPEPEKVVVVCRLNLASALLKQPRPYYPLPVLDLSPSNPKTPPNKERIRCCQLLGRYKTAPHESGRNKLTSELKIAERIHYYYNTIRLQIPPEIAGRSEPHCLQNQRAARACSNLLTLAQRPLDIALCVPLGGGFALVVQLFPFAEADQHFGVAVAYIHLQRHKRKAFLLGQAEQLMNLHLMQQQLARSRRVRRVVAVAFFVRADVHIVQENLAVADGCERIVQVCAAAPERLDLGTGQHDPRFVRVLDEVVVGRFFVLRQRLIRLTVFAQFRFISFTKR